jgi:hypothetical protein
MKSPILMIVFCRPETTEKVFESVRLAQPPRLYVASDAPRANKNGELDKCEQVLEIFKKVDWPCDVKFFKQLKNAGCSKGPFDAITWFFENETEGIILEDDIVPILDFYRFCDEMLQRYRDDNRIQSISGWSYFYNGFPKKYSDSYYFSKITSSWGWATWRRVWGDTDLKLENVSRQTIKERLKSYNYPTKTIDFYLQKFKKIKKKYDSLSSWDYQFLFSMWNKDGFAIQPMYSLTRNIGIGDDATHNFNSELPNYPTKPIYPIKYPKFFLQNLELELLRIKSEKLENDGLLKRSWLLLKKIIKKYLIIINVCR